VIKLDDHIESIITRKLSGIISAEEQLELDSWMAASKDNANYFNTLKRLYTEAANKDETTYPHIDIDHEWKTFKNNIASEQSSKVRVANWLRVAASMILVTVLGYIFWNNAFQSNKITVIAQERGQQVILPDSSVITLNKGAKLTYPRIFAKKNRTLAMTGEAFFKVTRDENKPFIVNLGLSNVEVLGTSFNINAQKDNDVTEVVVNTGRVKFSNATTQESVILTKGEKGMLMKTSNLISKTQNNDVNFMAWKTRKIVFNDVELDEVIQTLNKLYDAHVSFSTDVGKDCKVTVTFDNQSLDAIMAVLEVTLDLEYKKSGDIIEVVKTGC